jgi:hypothetical protein
MAHVGIRVSFEFSIIIISSSFILEIERTTGRNRLPLNKNEIREAIDEEKTTSAKVLKARTTMMQVEARRTSGL